LGKKQRLCPLCHEPLEEGEKTCKNCESKIVREAAETIRAVMEPEEADESDEIGIDLGDLERTLTEIAETGEEPHLYLCPVCGVLLSEEATLCPRCGAEFLEGEEGDEEEEEEEPLKTHLCMECGAFVEEGASSCPECGVEIIGREPRPEDLEAELDEMGEVAEPVEREDEEPKRRSDALFLCPRCGAFLRADAESCEICGASLVDKKKIGIGDIHRIAPEAPEKDIGMCPTCGAFLDPETERCEICDAEVAERPEEVAEELLSELLPEADKDETEEEEDFEKELEELEEELEEMGGEPDLLEEEAAEEGDEVEPGEIDREIDDFFQELESVEIEKTMEEARLPPEPELVEEAELEEGAEPVDEELPKVTPKTPPEELIRKGKAKERARRVKWSLRGKGMARFREYSAFTAVVACIVEYVSLQFQPPGYEWIVIFLFAVLFAIGMSFLVSGFTNIPKKMIRNSLFFWLGAILVVAIPLHHFFGAASTVPALDYGLMAAGLGLSIFGIYLMGRGFQTHMIWTAGSMIVFVVALPIAFPLGSWPPSSGLEISVFIVGSAFVLVSFGFILYEKWLKLVMDTQILYGDESMRRRKPTESLKSYDAAIKTSTALSSAADTPSNFDLPWYSKGAALTILGRYEEALDCIDTAIKMDPENEVAWVNKGTALSRLGRHKEALRCFNEAIKQNPAYEVAWNNKGNTLARLKKLDEALKCYDMAIEIDEMYKEAWVNKGYILAKMGRYEDAARCADFVSSFASPR
jgi:Flp pilus assembly protein TadD/RNA polymerase subunit RPABC4/transcription elongation factor Spt4